MKPYGRNEALGLHSVDDERPDAADEMALGKGRRGRTTTRRSQKKVVRQQARAALRNEVLETKA